MKEFNKPTILLVHNFYQVPGGEDTVFNNEKKLLEDNGHKVITYTRNNKEIKDFSIFKKICYPINTIFSLKTYNEVKKKIKDNQIDIVHVHNTWPLISPSVFYASFHSKIPIVQTIHNFRMICPSGTLYYNGKVNEDSLYKGLLSSLRNKIYKDSFIHTLISVLTLKLHRLIGTYKKINYIFLTEFNKNKILELNNKNHIIIDESKTFIKPNFVNAEEKDVRLTKKKNQFVFVGRLDKLKGIDLLIEAWGDIKCYDLIICGTGPEEESCRKIIKKKNLKNIYMLGFVSNLKAREIIAESRALILPTQWYEGFPMTIVESFSVGTPVIGSDIGNVGSIINDKVTGLKFKFDSVKSLRTAILKFDEFDEQQLSDNVLQCFINNYSETVNYKMLNDIYKYID